MQKVLGLALGLSLFSMACVRELPPPAAPPKQKVELQTMPAGPIPAGAGRVVLDAEAGKGEARVVRVDKTEVSVATARGTGYGVSYSTQLICSKTPCAVDLPAGSHQLVFQATGDERDASAATFDVAAGRSHVVRHAIGHVEPHSGWKAVGATGISIGIPAAVVGGVLIPISGISDSDGMRTAGFVSLGAGVGLLTLGIVSLVIGRTEVQPGATTQWTLEPGDAEERPTSTRGEEHVRRIVPAKPKVIATGNGMGLMW